MYWSGDLAYRDAEGFCYFIGRSGDWLRVDGENMGTAPIERVLVRHPDVVEAAVYAVPDPQVGDQIMAALVLRDGAGLTPEDFASFLAAEHELGPKQVPRFVRLATELPRTSTHKIIKRKLAEQRWDCSDIVWFRDGPELAYRPLTDQHAS
jgi:fatty-acyl-CoA synthase